MIMDKETLSLLKREGVTFVGRGKKIVKGQQTEQDAVIIGVIEKKPLDQLTKSEILPKSVGGQKTDVVQTGKIKKRDYEEDRRIGMSRPVHPGTSCGHYAITAGTFGAVVYADVREGEVPDPPVEEPGDDTGEDECPETPNPVDCAGCEFWTDSGCWWDLPCPDIPNEKDCSPCSSWDGTSCMWEEDDEDNNEEEPPTPELSWWVRIILAILRWLGFASEAQIRSLALPCTVTKAFILSNNHVLANENATKIGDAIRQPGTYDGGTKDDTVARLYDYVALSRSKSNKVDCAIAELSVEYNPEILDVGVPKGAGTASVGEYITKSGRTTGTTKAKVIATDASSYIEYDLGNLLFERQIVTGLTDEGESSSDGGDSGSLGINDKGEAVGLLFAGSDEVTMYNPIDEVIAELKTKIHF